MTDELIVAGPRDWGRDGWKGCERKASAVRQMRERWCVMSFCVKYRRSVCARNGRRPTFWFVRILDKIITLHVAVRVLEIVDVDLEEVVVG